MNRQVETIIRTVLLIVALLNQILTSSGHSVIPIDDETITQVITLAFTIVTSLWSWWKNNSFTKTAIRADEYLDSLKEANKR